MLRSVAIQLFAIILVCSRVSADTKCFIVQESGRTIQQEGDSCSKRTSPCSTFKILISLMGYNEGILENESSPTWPYREGETPPRSPFLDIWNQPHNPRTWIQHSCIWYSQVITQKVGMETFKKYVELFKYGNRDLSGDKGRNNGLTNAWLSSSLKISPLEQIAFLEKLTRSELPVSEQTQQLTRHILFVEDLPGGWELYGKTGSGFDEHGNIAWFIGWVQKEDRILTFVHYCEGTLQPTQAKEEAKAKLISLVAEQG